MITLLDETEEVSTDMLTTLLASVKKDNQVRFLPVYKFNSLLPVNKLLGFDFVSFFLECFTNGLESCGEGS